MSKATPGRIVLVTVNPDTNDGHDVAPAIVTAVDKDGLVNVRVFGATGADWAASGLPLYGDRRECDKHGDDHALAAFFPTLTPAPAKPATPPAS